MPLVDIYLHQGGPPATSAKPSPTPSTRRWSRHSPSPTTIDSTTSTNSREGTVFHEDVVFGIPRSDRLMCITLSFNNRTAETKKALFESLVKHLQQKAGVPRKTSPSAFWRPLPRTGGPRVA